MKRLVLCASLLVVTLMMAFQNCNGMHFSKSTAPANGTVTTASDLTGGNGDVYDGKTYVLAGARGDCPANDWVKARIFQPRGSDKYFLVRRNCQDLAANVWVNITADITKPNAAVTQADFVIFEREIYRREIASSVAQLDFNLYSDGKGSFVKGLNGRVGLSAKLNPATGRYEGKLVHERNYFSDTYWDSPESPVQNFLDLLSPAQLAEYQAMVPTLKAAYLSAPRSTLRFVSCDPASVQISVRSASGGGEEIVHSDSGGTFIFNTVTGVVTQPGGFRLCWESDPSFQFSVRYMPEFFFHYFDGVPEIMAFRDWYVRELGEFRPIAKERGLVQLQDDTKPFSVFHVRD